MGDFLGQSTEQKIFLELLGHGGRGDRYPCSSLADGRVRRLGRIL